MRNFAKPFSIAGFVVGELIMLYTVLAPNLKGTEPVPWDAALMRIVVCAIFFGPFGAAAGLGIGLLVTGLFSAGRGEKPKPEE